ncbi:MAG: TIGR04282 family arsenosugar biosynthesis glycosyltransferase [Chitinophagaceae bacterium]
MKPALCVFVKNLRLGNVKTRLAARVGDAMALDMYKSMLQHTCHICSPLDVEKYVFYSDTLEGQDMWTTALFKKQLQQPGDLGARMQHAFTMLFEEHEKVVIVGSDCMELTSVIINQAFEVLTSTDVVLGPALDGGYYLVGMKKLHPVLFKDIPWSTDKVLVQTLQICNEQRLSYGLLPVLSDIDQEEDWLRFMNASTESLSR